MFRVRDRSGGRSAGTLILVRPRRTAAIGFAVTLAVAACGGSDEPALDAGAGDTSAPAPSAPTSSESGSDSTGGPSTPSEPSTGLTVADIDVPDVEVLSVPSGESVNVAEIALGQDTLFWFYAPH